MQAEQSDESEQRKKEQSGSAKLLNSKPARDADVLPKFGRGQAEQPHRRALLCEAGLHARLPSRRTFSISTQRAAAIMLSRAARPALRAGSAATLRYVEPAAPPSPRANKSENTPANNAIASPDQQLLPSPRSKMPTMPLSAKLKGVSSPSATSKRSPRP